MNHSETCMVTGAFSYTGRYVARRLLSMGMKVRTLTGHPREDRFGDPVACFPLDFSDHSGLRQSMQGVTTFYNTYWIRFPFGQVTYEKAVNNSKALIMAAKKAGVRRFVHISITNASERSRLPYFHGKGVVEQALIDSGLSYAIIRPTLVFGPGDILLNNVAWTLRRFPIFAMIGSGDYRVQPVFVEDVAKLMVDTGQDTRDSIIDAVGPEVFTFLEFVRLISDRIGCSSKVVHVNPRIAYVFSRVIGCLINDVVLTWDEIEGLMQNLLLSDGPATCETRLSEWLEENVDLVGVRYASELKRHYL